MKKRHSSKKIRIVVFGLIIFALASPGQAAFTAAASVGPQVETSASAGLFNPADLPSKSSTAGEHIRQGDRVSEAGAGMQNPAVRSRFVTVNLTQLGDIQSFEGAPSETAQALQLNLFDDTHLTAVLDKVETKYPGMFTWQGHIEGQEQDSQVRLTAKGQVLQGLVSTADAAYHLRYVGGGVHQIEQSAPQPFAAEGDAPDKPRAPADGEHSIRWLQQNQKEASPAAALERLLLQKREPDDPAAVPPAAFSPGSFPAEISNYLPVVLKPANPGKITGRVLQNGVPVSGVVVDLRFYDGAYWSTVMQATTDAGGAYQFVNAPALYIDQEYYVRYLNRADTAGRLSRWNTNSIYDYDNEGDLIILRDFDIADLPLVSPADGASISLANTFQWTRRTAAPGDSYGLYLYNDDYSEEWETDVDLGYVERYRMVGLPDGLATGKVYNWLVYIYSDSGYGESRMNRAVTFTSAGLSGITGRVLRGGATQSGVPVDLYIWDGSDSWYQSTVNTDANGVYQFASAASLSGGDTYFVEYWNEARTAGRVDWWDTFELGSYTAGTNYQFNDIDIADVALSLPYDGASAGLPLTFSWTKRSATPTDDYQFRIYEDANGSSLRTSYLGYVNSYQMVGLEFYLDTGTDLTWYIRVHNPGGYGESLYSRNVKITNRGLTGISGRVLQNGSPASGVKVRLQFFDGCEWSTQWTTYSGADGVYQIANQPALAAGQSYQVYYQNDTYTEGRLWSWYAPAITSYPSYGGNVTVNDFDIADVPLVAPTSGVPVSVPTTFQWMPRPASPDDRYELDLIDGNSYKRWWSLWISYSGSYLLNYVPVPFYTDTEYYWYIVVYNNGGMGESYANENITFSSPAGSGINGMVYQDGRPAHGVELELWHYNGSTWSAIFTTSTNSKGLYQFIGAPALTSGQKYVVEFNNDEDIEGYLRWWDSDEIISYTPGQNLHLPYFDIADIPLVNPAEGASVDLPMLFGWTRRANTPVDDYEFNLFDLADDDPHWWTDPTLGYVGSYILWGAPGGFTTGVPYAWDVWVYGPGGFGESNYARGVAFTSAGLLKSAMPAPAGSRLTCLGCTHRHSR